MAKAVEEIYTSSGRSSEAESEKAAERSARYEMSREAESKDHSEMKGGCEQRQAAVVATVAADARPKSRPTERARGRVAKGPNPRASESEKERESVSNGPTEKGFSLSTTHTQNEHS